MYSTEAHSSNHAKQTVGKVLTSITVVNRADQILVENGIIQSQQVRSVKLDNVLVDTGATTLCLPMQSKS